MAKQRGRCAFCKYEGRLSREHVWADWLRAYLPRNPNRKTVHTTGQSLITGGRTVGQTETRGELHRDGDPRSQKLRVVCSTCNNKWMSQLQKQAKPLIGQLVRGEWPQMGPAERRLVAAWCTMFTLVLEMADPARCVTTQAKREAFAKNQRPLPRWAVYVGWMVPGDVWNGGFVHWAVPRITLMNGGEIQETITINQQFTAAVADRLYIQTWSDDWDQPEVDHRELARLAGLSLIWPNDETGTISQPTRVMTAQDADDLVQDFRGPEMVPRPIHSFLPRPATRSPRTNEPCPCGSGQPFTQCHGVAE